MDSGFLGPFEGPRMLGMYAGRLHIGIRAVQSVTSCHELYKAGTEDSRGHESDHKTQNISSVSRETSLCNPSMF